MSIVYYVLAFKQCRLSCSEYNMIQKGVALALGRKLLLTQIMLMSDPGYPKCSYLLKCLSEQLARPF